MDPVDVVGIISFAILTLGAGVAGWTAFDVRPSRKRPRKRRRR